jgi:hypothetical protein
MSHAQAIKTQPPKNIHSRIDAATAAKGHVSALNAATAANKSMHTNSAPLQRVWQHLRLLMVLEPRPRSLLMALLAMLLRLQEFLVAVQQGYAGLK